MFRMRPYVPALILFVGCGLVWRSRSQVAVPLDKPIGSVLREMDGYQVVDQKITPREQRVAGMSNYVARAYRRDEAVAFTTLVSYYERQTQGKTIHSPRNCLPGAGWEIISGETRQIVIDNVPRTVNRYVLKNQRATAIAYYWYQGRGRVTANEYVVKWNLLRDAALRGRTEEALVRVVVPVGAASKAGSGDASIRAADAVGQAVAMQLMAAVDEVLPSGGD